MLPVISSPFSGKFCESRRAPLTLLFLAALLACLLAPAAARGADISNANFTWVESAGALTVHTNAGTTAWRNALSYGDGSYIFPGRPQGVSYHSYSQVRSVTIGPSVTEIGDGAFLGCDKLARIDVPETVMSIGNNAFSACLELASVSLPDSVTYIGDSTFLCCPLLTALTFPEALEQIGPNAFYYSGLTTLAFESMAAPTVDSVSIVSLFALTTIYVPEGASGYGGSGWPGPPVSYVQVPLPQFSVQPRDATADEGQAAGFTASASNPVPACPLRYQWQLSRDGGRTWADIPGATGAAYATDPATPQMNGWRYRCRARNLGAAASDAAVLTVIAAPEPSPKTGDGARPALWLALALLALAGSAALRRRRV